jgi:hypothetical protein
MAGGSSVAWRKLPIPSRFLFTRRISSSSSSSSSGIGAFDSPPAVCSRRVVVTGNSLSLSHTRTWRNPLKIEAL